MLATIAFIAYWLLIPAALKDATTCSCVAINGVAPAVHDGTFKFGNTAVLNIKGTIAIRRGKHDNIWRDDITGLEANSGRIGISIAGIADGVDVVANGADDARVVGISILPTA